MKQHDRETIGNTDTARRNIALKTEPAFDVKGQYGKYSARFDLEQSQRARFESDKKCKFCGFDWPHPKGPTSCQRGVKNAANVSKKIISLDVAVMRN